MNDAARGDSSAREQRHTACNRDCPDACGIVATVEEGRITRLAGDPNHPVTRGFLCHRTSRFLERQYAPDRLTSPLRRDGEGFVPVSWDEALDDIARRLLAVRAESGPAAILAYRSGGSMGILKSLVDFFFERFGPVTVKSGDVCTGAGDAAQMTDFGDEDSHDFFDPTRSRTIILWGKNLHVSSVHLIPVLLEARSRGARLVSVDPVRHKTAALCDLFVQPRPGGDIALALGVARRMFEAGTTDPHASDYCDHLDFFLALARSRSVETWADLAGVPLASLEALADAYAICPAALHIGCPRRPGGRLWQPRHPRRGRVVLHETAWSLRSVVRPARRGGPPPPPRGLPGACHSRGARSSDPRCLDQLRQSGGDAA
jgi:anaerobic selenocysteine-containing dehydrogenase